MSLAVQGFRNSSRVEPNILDRPVGSDINEALALGLSCNDEVHLKLPAFCDCSRVESNMMNHPLGSDVNAALALGCCATTMCTCKYPPGETVQEFLAREKPPPPRTPPEQMGPVVVLREGAVSYEQGTPVPAWRTSRSGRTHLSQWTELWGQLLLLHVGYKSFFSLRFRGVA